MVGRAFRQRCGIEAWAAKESHDCSWPAQALSTSRKLPTPTGGEPPIAGLPERQPDGSPKAARTKVLSPRHEGHEGKRGQGTSREISGVGLTLPKRAGSAFATLCDFFSSLLCDLCVRCKSSLPQALVSASLFDPRLSASIRGLGGSTTMISGQASSSVWASLARAASWRATVDRTLDKRSRSPGPNLRRSWE